ncbi:oxygen-independent coproporphyrinogen III oxidase [Reyranella sp.]|uniref:oxygen-independent coproporphyrinogen III oxidase n=1 Tax=Reyranella sp. TaxID=1929291 RepID=UPI003BAC4F4D
MDPSTAAAYDKPVPRYTSYPTAAQFDASVGPAEHAAWLAGLGGRPATLYLHVPFCRELCFYCACHTGAMRQPATLDAYAAALVTELEAVAAAARDVTVAAVQWGGGTPSQLGPRRLIDIGRRIPILFDVRPGREMSMEVDPRYCDRALVDAMAMLGVTRASLGVQDFDIGVQKAINRLQSPEVTAAAIDRMRAGGIGHINVDLVFGLPGQTVESLSRTLDQAIALAPDRFAVFAYAHVPWMKRRQAVIDERTLPGAPVRAAMAELVSQRIEGAGYVKVGLDHYARPDDALARAVAERRLRRSFQGYVADETPWVIGVGASAISSLPQGFSQNAVATADYLAAVQRGAFATARGIAWSDSDRLRGDIISALMCHFDVDLAEVCERHGAAVPPLLAEVPRLQALIDDGMARLDGTHLLVTERGRPVVRSVCAAFDRHYTGAEGRHARGI